jgi:hypothetical protein
VHGQWGAPMRLLLNVRMRSLTTSPHTLIAVPAWPSEVVTGWPTLTLPPPSLAASPTATTSFAASSFTHICTDGPPEIDAFADDADTAGAEIDLGGDDDFDDANDGADKEVCAHSTLPLLRATLSTSTIHPTQAPRDPSTLPLPAAAHSSFFVVSTFLSPHCRLVRAICHAPTPCTLTSGCAPPLRW